MKKKRKSLNRLNKSQSPYLLQHASNPVDWYPWGKEAFKIANEKNRPIFLSIGYSTCHWCHVMEKESFEDPIVAKQMNDTFINIKVDREEMPEVDHLYMSVCQAMTGRGGWPLTIVMTPKKKPFFSGTYFPKTQRGTIPGMLQLIPSLNNAWINRQNEIHDSINKVEKFLIDSNSFSPGEKWNETIFHRCVAHFQKRFDHENGGFGTAPKFPSSHNLIFLIRYSHIYKKSKVLNMVEKTLQKMRLGGIYDHIGFGFHRYSTDKNWYLPHFEKMLYDQAMNAFAYLEAYQITKNSEYAEIASEIFSYVLRDLKNKEGGFYSAEDADSEGEEGTFYLWTEKEVLETLGEKGKIFSRAYGFSEIGNYLDESSRMRNGKNIPFLKEHKYKIAKKLNINLSSLNHLIETSRIKLFKRRKERIHPFKDNKILTDWNGLIIASLAQAGIILKNKKYIKESIQAFEFINKHLTTAEGRLFKRYYQGKSGLDPHLNDYSFLVWGLINLWEATFETRFIIRALELLDIMIEDFYDENGGFYIGSKDAEKLMVRTKDYYEGAIPSGNSVAVLSLFKLGKITGNENFANIAHKTLKAFSKHAEISPTSFTNMLSAFLFDAKCSKELVIVLDKNKHSFWSIIEDIRETYSPQLTIIVKDTRDKILVDKVCPWINSYTMINRLPTYFVCKNFACRRPTTDLETALNYLS